MCVEHSDNEAHILASWHANALPWIDEVRAGRIETRRLVTDRAVIDAILATDPRMVLDLGCGEGWLCRALSDRGIEATGVDAIPELVATARRAGGADYHVLTYAQVQAGALQRSFDAVVCNFSLLGETSVDDLVGAVPRLLNPDGVFVVQTLHPVTACGTHPYEDGWRDGSWSGFSDTFADPAPWYFRTIESWVELFRNNRLRLSRLVEPCHPETGQPASVIFVLQGSD
jgi:2-polyprenyl-3-methyl-5-hydroxy-6-metoxy-1,4-benzoquinol methylase